MNHSLLYHVLIILNLILLGSLFSNIYLQYFLELLKDINKPEGKPDDALQDYIRHLLKYKKYINDSTANLDPKGTNHKSIQQEDT